MSGAKVFLSALHLIIVMLIFSIGSFFVILYFYPAIFFSFINLIINNPEVVLKAGFFTLVLAFILFIVFYMINKAQYVKFTMERNKFLVNSNLIKDYIEKYLQASYPTKKNKLEVCVHSKDKLEIIASVDSLDYQKEFLLDIEKKIGKLLSEHFNYRDDFIFTLKSKK